MIKYIGNVLWIIFGIGVIGILVGYTLGMRPYITLSGSMEPNIKTGSVCIVDTNATYETIQEGEIIAFQTKTGSMVTHRVMKISEKGMETKGDANEVSDGITTTKENFCGKTIGSIPYLGYCMKYLQQPQCMIVIILILCIGIIDNLLFIK